MTPPSRLTGAAGALAVAAALAFPGGAGAVVGTKTFQQTFPQAAKLCAKVAAGTENKHLKHFVTQVTADCTALQSTFTSAQSTVVSARTSITAQIAADRAAIATACPASSTTKPACVSTRAGEEAAIAVLNRQLRTARRTYWSTLETARHTFWNAIRSLPGESHVHADTPLIGTAHS
jgi:hypothetical protein